MKVINTKYGGSLRTCIWHRLIERSREVTDEELRLFVSMGIVYDDFSKDDSLFDFRRVQLSVYEDLRWR